MIVNRQGVTRIVILTGRFAIKFPRFGYGWRFGLQGLLANMQEREFGAAGWPELCPVLFALPGGFALVMRRAEPLTDEQWEAFDPEAFRNSGLPDRYIPVEGKRDSFGMIDGKIVAIDYGN